MIVETAILSGGIAIAIRMIRHNWREIAQIWREARWYEKALLAFALLPILGPLEEAVGALVVVLIVRHRHRTERQT